MHKKHKYIVALINWKGSIFPLAFVDMAALSLHMKQNPGMVLDHTWVELQETHDSIG